MVANANFIDGTYEYNGASSDHTNLYKSYVKTLRARKKAEGISPPNSRIFPENKSEAQLPSCTAQFFLKARQIQENILRHRRLILDHRKRYLGKLNDPAAMSHEECVYMDKVISTNFLFLLQTAVLKY